MDSALQPKALAKSEAIMKSVKSMKGMKTALTCGRLRRRRCEGDARDDKT